jgi:DNA-binding CsgD family transcriptional regulator/tetratricopeptide (TPR) repeat protein
VALTGEAGIGKTRLVAEATADASAQGFRVLRGACYPQDGSSPYAPVLDLLRSSLTSEAMESIVQATDPLARALFPVLPDLVWMPSDVGPLPSLDPAQEQLRLFAALRQIFLRLAMRQPLLVVMEDLHWSDDTTLAFVLTLVRRIAALPMLVLLTYRDDEPRPPRAWLAQMNREHHAPQIELDRLDRDEVGAMLRATLDGPRSPHPTLVSSIHGLTGGNPFFVEELLASLASGGQLHGTDVSWEWSPPLDAVALPLSIRELIGQRLAPLDAATRHVLALAAVAGRTFDLTLLSRLTGWRDTRLLHALREGVAAQLIAETGAGRFAFRHELTRQAISSDLLAHEHRTLHAAIAEALELTARDAPGVGFADLAYHFYEAGLWARALDYALSASAQGHALHDPLVALTEWNRVFAAANRMGRPVEAHWYRARGDAHHLLGNFDSARSDYETGLSVARGRDDGGEEWEALIDLGELWTARGYAEAGAFFEQARDRARTLDDQIRHAHSLNRIANWRLNTGPDSEGVRLHLAALHIFRTHDDLRGVATTLDQLGMAHSLTGDLHAAVDWYDQAVRAQRDQDDSYGLVYSLQGRGVFGSPCAAETTAAALRSRDDCVRDVEEAIGLARQNGDLAGEAFAAFGASSVYASFGDLGLALSRARDAARIATDIGHQQWRIGAAFAHGCTLLAMGAPDLALADLEAALPLARGLGSDWWIGNVSAYLGLAHTLRADFASAAATLAGVLASGQAPRTMPERRVAWVWSVLMLARAEPEMALRVADSLIATTPNTEPPQHIPSLLKVRGEALLALRRVGAATRALVAARDAALARGNRPLLWTISAALARAYRGTHQEAESEAELEAARAVIATVQETIDDTALRQRFASAASESLPHGVQAQARRVAATRFGGLTRRELEVAGQIAQGKSNREIAEALVLGERTIETHVGSILSKLGFSARTQVALWAVDQGLADRCR